MTRWLAGLGLLACLGALGSGCSSRRPPPDVVRPPDVSAPAPVPPAPDAGPPEPAPDAPSPETPLADPLACAVFTGPGEPISTIALHDPIDPAHAPVPANASERLVFRQLYETLLRVDCEGQLRPGLAESWTADPDGHTWRVVLRPETTFADGTRVTAAEVMASLQRAGAGTPSAAADVVISMAAIDDRTLAVGLRDAVSEPRILAHPDLAVVKDDSGRPWPIGTRGLAVSEWQPAAGASGRAVLTLARGPAPPDGRDAPALRVLIDPARDPRDALDQGVDLLLTRHPAALDYARTLTHYRAVPLAWTETRVFASRWRQGTEPPLIPEARQALTADAVRGDARGAEGPFWWEQDLQACAVADAPPPTRTTQPTGNVVYERGDDPSRELAERIVGLAASAADSGSLLAALVPDASRRIFQRALGLSGSTLRDAQQRGADTGYIVSLERRPLYPCGAWQQALARLGWLQPSALVPLTDTRLWAIARADRAGATQDWDGALVIAAGTDVTP